MNDEEKAKIIAAYIQESQQDDARYSPLQCAAYKSDRVGVQVILDECRRTNTLQQELRYAGGKFGENILHIAIKDPFIFRQCCDALQSVDLFEPTLLQADGDGDTVMHQVVEFGRKESLEILTSDDEMRPLLLSVIEAVNRHGETPLEIANTFENSVTITALKADGVLKEEHLVVAQQNLSSIMENLFHFLQLERPGRAPGM